MHPHPAQPIRPPQLINPINNHPASANQLIPESANQLSTMYKKCKVFVQKHHQICHRKNTQLNENQPNNHKSPLQIKNCTITQLPNYPIVKLPNSPIVELSNCQIAKLSNYLCPNERPLRPARGISAKRRRT